MSFYWVGDKPIEALVLVPTRNGTPLDLEQYVGVSGILVKPNGVSLMASDRVSLEDGALEVDFGAGDSWFTQAGLYQLRCTLEGADGRQERLDAIQIVVHADDGWHTLPSARSEWQDAPARDERLWPLLELAKQQVLAFAPALEDGQLPPLNYRHAQLLQARNLFNAGRVDPSTGDAGGEGFSLTPFPLDWNVKQLLRPKNPRPVAL